MSDTPSDTVSVQPKKRPEKNTHEKNPPAGGISSNEKSKEPSSALRALHLVDDHLEWLIGEYPLRESAISRFMENGAPRHHAINCLAKAWVKKHVLDWCFDDEARETAHAELDKAQKAAIRDELTARIVDDRF